MDKGISIPKYRFDEVNEALKKPETESLSLRRS